MEFKKALEIANRLVELLSPSCEKINIAGSVRRQKPFVNDIEIICTPKTEVLKDRFGWDEGIIRSPLFAKTVAELGNILKGKNEGKYMQIELPEKINLDLFIPDDFISSNLPVISSVCDWWLHNTQVEADGRCHRCEGTELIEQSDL